MIRLLKWLGIYPVLEGVLGSLHNKEEGYSGRKLAALTLTVCTVHLVWKYSQKGDYTNLPEILIILETGIAFFLALITTEQILKAYNIAKGKEEKKDEPA